MIGAASVGMLIGEEKSPTVAGGGLGDRVDVAPWPAEEGKVIEPARRSVVRSSPVRRFLDHDVGICKLPAPPAGPVLERGVAEGAKEPSPARNCSLKAWNLDLDVVNEAGAHRRMFSRCEPPSHPSA